jgi:hypothetical protein
MHTKGELKSVPKNNAPDRCSFEYFLIEFTLVHLFNLILPMHLWARIIRALK